MCEDEDTTTYLRECARGSMDVVAGVRIVKCHASIDVGGVSRKHTCRHWHSHFALSPTHRFPTFLNFHFVNKCSLCCHPVTVHHNFYL